MKKSELLELKLLQFALNCQYGINSSKENKEKLLLIKRIGEIYNEKK